ncbi:MAG: hypothetical protein L3J66_12510 [Bacteroidales bacterium]|nr:hypothetical protein [Bacteroidales bacterium]
MHRLVDFTSSMAEALGLLPSVFTAAWLKTVAVCRVIARMMMVLFIIFGFLSLGHESRGIGDGN